MMYNVGDASGVKGRWVWIVCIVCVHVRAYVKPDSERKGDGQKQGHGYHFTYDS